MTCIGNYFVYILIHNHIQQRKTKIGNKSRLFHFFISHWGRCDVYLPCCWTNTFIKPFNQNLKSVITSTLNFEGYLYSIPSNPFIRKNPPKNEIIFCVGVHLYKKWSVSDPYCKYIVRPLSYNPLDEFFEPWKKKEQIAALSCQDFILNFPGNIIDHRYKYVSSVGMQICIWFPIRSLRCEF